MHLLYLQEQRLRIPLGGRDTNRKEERCVTKNVVTNHSKETRRWASAPVRMGRLLGWGEKERERERAREREKWRETVG